MKGKKIRVPEVIIVPGINIPPMQKLKEELNKFWEKNGTDWKITEAKTEMCTYGSMKDPDGRGPDVAAHIYYTTTVVLEPIGG